MVPIPPIKGTQKKSYSSPKRRPAMRPHLERPGAQLQNHRCYRRRPQSDPRRARQRSLQTDVYSMNQSTLKKWVAIGNLYIPLLFWGETPYIFLGKIML